MTDNKTDPFEHSKYCAILCHSQAAQISCPFNVGDHSRSDLYYCGQLFKNADELFHHLVDKHTPAEVKALFEETEYDKKADKMELYKRGRGHKPEGTE